MELQAESSEYILLRESEDSVRRRSSQTSQPASSLSTESPSSARTRRNPFHRDDDYQGRRGANGILLYREYGWESTTVAGDVSTTVTGTSNSDNKKKREEPIKYDPNVVIATTDLEVWWVTSPNWRRFIPIFCIFCLICFFGHLGTGIYYLFYNEYDNIEDPYICNSENCQRIRESMEETMNTSVDPCVDFYSYMCGNITEDTNNPPPKDMGWLPPTHIYYPLRMWVVNGDIIGDDLLARILKTSEDNPIIKFYKSCIDSRSRKREGIKPFLELIDVTKLTSKDVDLNTIGAILSNYTGNFMFFDYTYRTRIRISVEAEAGMSRSFIDEIITQNGGEDILKLFQLLPTELEKIKEASEYNDTGVGDLPTDAVNCIQELCKKVKEIYEFCKDVSRAEVKTFEDATPEELKLFDFIKTLSIAEGIDFSVGKHYNILFAKDFCYLHRDKGKLHTVAGRLSNSSGFSEGKIKFTFRVVWVLHLFLTYAKDFDASTFELITKNPKSIIFKPYIDFRNFEIELQCFQSLAINYQFIAFDRFARDFNTTKIMKSNVVENGRQVQRILRKWVALGYFSHLSYDDQQTLKYETAPESSLNVLIEEKLYRQTDLKLDFREWIPDVKKYMKNVWIARRFAEDQMTNDWFYSEKFTPWHTKRGNILLLTVQTIQWITYTTPNIQDIIFVPLPLLTKPFVTNSYRVLNYAGVTTYVARELVRLSLSTLEKLFDLNEFDDSSANNESCVCYGDSGSPCSHSITLQFSNGLNCSSCCYSPKRVNVFSSALALKLAYELYQKNDEYRSFKYHEGLYVDFEVEPTYIPLSGGDGYTIEYNSYKPRPVEDVEYEYKKFELYEKVGPVQLKYKYPLNTSIAPKFISGMEQFTQDQFFFMQFTRLHCYSKSDDDEYKKNVNKIIGQVKEFSDAWNCGEDTPMNPKRKLFQH